MMTLYEQNKLRDYQERNIEIWDPCNIYDSAVIGDNVSIGAFTEVGANVVIGNNVRIGKGCFIPEGVIIEDDCFIGPHVCFTNDRFPQSPKENWESTFVRRGARLGANVSVICGVCIGEEALIGAGSVVTKDIPNNDIWAGVPATKLRQGEML